ncbi:MAG: hypothetical protein R3F54_30630 [Alphaproteobacteria bacterium]
MAESADWRDPLRKIAWHIGQDHYPSGDLATLRRLDPDCPDGRAFWALVHGYAEPAFDDDRAARALAAVIRCLAIAHPFHRPKDGERRGFGDALALAGVSEMRLLRILNLQAKDLPNELRRLARLLASKGDAGRADWSQAFALLHGRDGEKIRTDIAKAYYRQQFTLAKDKEEQAA